MSQIIRRSILFSDYTYICNEFNLWENLPSCSALLFFLSIFALPFPLFSKVFLNNDKVIVTLTNMNFILSKEISSKGSVSVQFTSVQSLSHVGLCNTMNLSTPGLPVHHQLPEFTQTHVHRVGDAIQPSHPLSLPFPPAPNPSQHQSLFQ